MLASSGEMIPPCGVPVRLAAKPPCLLAPARAQERSDQADDLAVVHPFSHLLHEDSVVDVVDAGLDVALDDPLVVRRPAAQVMDLGDGILGSPIRPVHV